MTSRTTLVIELWLVLAAIIAFLITLWRGGR